MTLRKFVCSSEGFREEKHLKRPNRKRKPRNITCFGCLAKFEIARDQITGQWYVKNFIDEHNHPMVPRDLACFLRSHRRISDEQKADIVEMQISGIRKHQIMEILEMQYGVYDKVGCTTRDLYNFCHRYKVETVAAGDAKTVISYLTELQRGDPDFFFKYRTDGDGHLKGLIWCDSQSLLDYKAFGDVIVFDSTYKTNRYNLPLVPFVGVNHHRSTILFGCGFISQENIESYVWLLTAFTDAMNQKRPVSVITDGDRAMHRAISLVWPNSSHRLCMWHIELNIVCNLGNGDVKDDFRRFLYDCCSIDEIERKWLAFLHKYKVTDGLVNIILIRSVFTSHDGRAVAKGLPFLGSASAGAWSALMRWRQMTGHPSEIWERVLGIHVGMIHCEIVCRSTNVEEFSKSRYKRIPKSR